MFDVSGIQQHECNFLTASMLLYRDLVIASIAP